MKWMNQNKRGPAPLEKICSSRGKISKQGEVFRKVSANKKNSLMGFTLVEIMIVIGILALLLGMGVFSINKARLQSYISKAKADIASLEIAISMYEVDMGSYPVSDDSLVDDLTNPEGKGENWHGPYIEFDEEDIPGGNFQDPWDNDYVYANPGTHNTSSYDIYSTGPDGEGTGEGADDINNW